MPALGPVQTSKQISTTRRQSFHEIQFPIYMPPKRKNLKSIIDDLEPGSQDNNGSDDGSEFSPCLLWILTHLPRESRQQAYLELFMKIEGTLSQVDVDSTP